MTTVATQPLSQDVTANFGILVLVPVILAGGLRLAYLSGKFGWIETILSH